MFVTGQSIYQRRGRLWFANSRVRRFQEYRLVMSQWKRKRYEVGKYELLPGLADLEKLVGLKDPPRQFQATQVRDEGPHCLEHRP